MKDLYEIAELDGDLILTRKYSSKALAKRYGIEFDEAVIVRELAKAFRSQDVVSLLDSGYSKDEQEVKWAVLQLVLPSRYSKELLSGDWDSVYTQIGESFGLSRAESMEWGRWVLAGDSLKQEEPENELELENGYYVANKKVWYDKEADVYITYIPGLPHAVQLPGAVHRDLIRAYSNFDGNQNI